MADLTLDEYRGVSKRELRQRLKEEALRMFGPDSFENNSTEKKSPAQISSHTYCPAPYPPSLQPRAKTELPETYSIYSTPRRG